MKILAEQLSSRLNALLQGGKSRMGSMARCTATFNEAKELIKVEDFTTCAELYRRIERISVADALAGLPLLLMGESQTWCRE